MGVGIGDDGFAAAVFGTGAHVEYVYQDSTGTVSSAVTISSLPGSSYYLDAASTPLGLGIIGWNQGENLWVARHLE